MSWQWCWRWCWHLAMADWFASCVFSFGYFFHVGVVCRVTRRTRVGGSGSSVTVTTDEELTLPRVRDQPRQETALERHGPRVWPWDGDGSWGWGWRWGWLADGIGVSTQAPGGPGQCNSHLCQLHRALLNLGGKSEPVTDHRPQGTGPGPRGHTSLP